MIINSSIMLKISTNTREKFWVLKTGSELEKYANNSRTSGRATILELQLQLREKQPIEFND